jgi:dihydrolipoamide dehydrogenase
MTNPIEVKVPDIGDFKDVPVIEILVKAGDQIKAEDPLVMLESDKATMEVPAPLAGTVVELKVSVGDTVSEGSLLLTLTTSVESAAPVAPPADAVAPESAIAAAPAPAGSYAGPVDVECEMLVLGAGPGG